MMLLGKKRRNVNRDNFGRKEVMVEFYVPASDFSMTLNHEPALPLSDVQNSGISPSCIKQYFSALG